MKHINVFDLTPQTDNISVITDSFGCNHYSAEETNLLRFEPYDDLEWEEKRMVCQKCGAVQDIDGKWMED